MVKKVLDYQLLAVCDGHGSEGHTVAEYIAKNLARTFEKYLNRTKVPISTSIKEAVLNLDAKLEASNIRSETSGTTLCGVLMHG